MCCLISSGVAVVSCSNKKKYEWKAAVTSPAMYPIRIYNSILIHKKGYTYLDSGSFTTDEWGVTGRMNDTDGGAKPAPYHLVVIWLSWTESKFYKGSFDLPKEKIEQYFKEGYLNYWGKWETYNTILVGMAPEGVVVVWLVGGGAQVEIARFQAEETNEVSVKDIAPGANGIIGEYPSLKEYTEKRLASKTEIREYINQHGLSNHVWDKYRELYSYRIAIEYESEKGKTNKLCQRLYNGEFKWFTPAEIATPTYSMQARAKEIAFDWFDGKQIYRAYIAFDEKEIFSVYEQMYPNSPEEKGEIVIKINSTNDGIRLFFRGSNVNGTDFNEIMLYNTDVEIEKIDKEDYEGFEKR